MIGNDINLPSVGSQPVPKNENYKVDVDRGVHIRFTKGHEFPEGMAVYMYLDRPGHFYNDHAKPVPPQVAAAAGYDVEPLLKARRKQEAMASAVASVEEQFREGDTVNEVIEENGEYRVVHRGNQMFMVEFEDGTALLPRPVSKEMALKAYRKMQGIEEPAPAKK